MSKLTRKQSALLTDLALKVEKQRELDRLSRALKAQTKEIVSELKETQGLSDGDQLVNSRVAVTFDTKTGGDYHVPKWSSFGVNKLVIF